MKFVRWSAIRKIVSEFLKYNQVAKWKRERERYFKTHLEKWRMKQYFEMKWAKFIVYCDILLGINYSLLDSIQTLFPA